MKTKTGIQKSTSKRVYKYIFYTYGVVTREGIAVTEKKNEHPFVEIRNDDVIWDGKYEAKFPESK